VKQVRLAPGHVFRKLNAAVEGTPLARVTLEAVILEVSEDPERRELFDSAAQAWSHGFYWNCLSPSGGGRPRGSLARAIDARFGGFDGFREAFIDVAKRRFGSGWAWLVLDRGELGVTSTPNAELPLARGQQALLTCDVWEHAYYLDYRHERPRYLAAFLDNLVNWDFVAAQFAVHGEDPRVAASA